MPPDKHLLQSLDTVALPESIIASYALHRTLQETSPGRHATIGRQCIAGTDDNHTVRILVLSNRVRCGVRLLW